jgi:hypothetical protein
MNWRAIVMVGALGACAVDEVPDGARLTPDGAGPLVVFDLVARPFPAIPFPNDVVTAADPTSRTGRRLALGLTGTTRLETSLRAGLARSEGWGTFAPITVSFREPIALDDVARRTRDYDPSDDPFYVVDLTTGDPVPLDLGKGSFPLPLVANTPNANANPRTNQDVILFESVEEAAGVDQSGYTPAIDTDFDGVVDHPNTLGGTIIDWYERQTDTLRLRPTVPLAEKHEYAVVLTDRLRGQGGAPVRSPFEFIHHAAQRDGAERVRAILADDSRQAWFGDLAGTGLDHVAFVWTFTTGPAQEDMRLLRDGLYGQGPFAALGADFPPTAHALPLVSGTASCAGPADTPFVIKTNAAKDALERLMKGAGLAASGDQLAAVVDHLVVGTFDAPYLLGDPAHEDPSATFDVDFRSGSASVAHDAVPFFLSVPREGRGAVSPFPVTVWASGSDLHAPDLFTRAMTLAGQGVALMVIGVPGRGLAPDSTFAAAASASLPSSCYGPFVPAIGSGLHTTTDGTPLPFAGPSALLWSVEPIHTRDRLRQGAVQLLQATRILRTWDGVLRGQQDGNGDQTPDLAGDFDGDGKVDVGSPVVRITASGDGFGGDVAVIAGALDPNVLAVGAVSAGGGLSDVATRTALDGSSPLARALGPTLIAAPANLLPQTKCVPPQRSVRIEVPGPGDTRDVEIACLSPDELDLGRTVVLTNVTTGDRRCARTSANGALQVPIPASSGDRLDVQVYGAPDVVTSYATCAAVPGAPIGRRIQTFEQGPAAPLSPDDEKQCAGALAAYGVDATTPCQIYRTQAFPVGSPLVAPDDGLGLRSSSPELRRFVDVAQVALDPADPVGFAAFYGPRSAPGPDGNPLPPRGLFVIPTAGDPVVPTSTGYALGRAAGLVPFLPPVSATALPGWAEYATPETLFDDLEGATPNEVLARAFVLEGASRFGRTRALLTCAPNYTTSGACTSPPAASACQQALFDADWLSEGQEPWMPEHPPKPLRLVRAADVRATDAASLVASWQPRLVGAPFTLDASAWGGNRPLAGIVNAWLEPLGTHSFGAADPCKTFASPIYYDGLLARFFATAGHDLAFVSHPASHLCLERASCDFAH